MANIMNDNLSGDVAAMNSASRNWGSKFTTRWKVSYEQVCSLSLTA